jgi:myo-inositol 2-dehydrogenase / D-chiro-inositol 1-dehydrogenase
MLRLGVVGVGRLGSLFARALDDHPDVDTLVLAGSRPDSADALAEELSATACPSPEQVFDSVDAAVIAASTSAHPLLIRGAAVRGIPIFCEKPLTLDLASTDEVITSARSAGVELQVGFQRRFDPGYRAARNAVSNGEVGDVYLVNAASLDPEPSPEGFVQTSGDLYRDLMVHDFDAIRFVTGHEIEEVFIAGTADFPAFEVYQRHHDAGVAGGTIRLSNGSIATVAATRHNPAGYDIRMEVHGSRGSVAVGWDDRMPLRSAEPGVAAPPGPPYRDFLDRFAPAYRAEMHAFVDLVAGRSPNPCPPEDARAAFVAALAAGRSAVEGRPVAIAEFP